VRDVAFPLGQETIGRVIEGSVAWRAFDVEKFITECNIYVRMFIDYFSKCVGTSGITASYGRVGRG
jgi:hypothetical protein